MLPQLSREDADEVAKLGSQGASIADLVRNGRVQIEQASRNHLRFTSSHMGQAYWVLLRADLNNDGVEDVLVSTYKWATGGTFAFGDVLVLTRQAADEQFRVVDGVDLLPMPPHDSIDGELPA